jgi:hypothetical protein
MRSSIAAIKRHRTARLAKLATKAYYFHKRGKHDQMYGLVCDEFVSFGGVYVKFLQGVMLKSNIMKNWQNPEKLRIFENLDTEPLNIKAILAHELGPKKLKEIALIQPEPFAAGSFGQVYYAQHANGKPIVIKVLRPMVRELLKFDLRLLTRFSKSFFSRMPNMQVKMDDAIRDFRQATLRETDYVEEARFAHELHVAYKDHPKLIIPETYLELCTPNIIVQEYVDGLSVAQLVKLHEQGVDPREYVFEHTGSDLDEQLIVLGFESLNGVFNLPRIQGDPHPGNIRLLSGNRVGLIDFGISARTPSNKAAFFGLIEEWDRLYAGTQSIANMFEQFIRFFVSDLYRALKKLSSFNNSDPETAANFTKEVGKVAQETFSKVLGTDDITPLIENGRILQIVNQIVNKQNRFGLIMKLEASEILRAAQTYITLVESLGRRNVVLPKVFSLVVNQVKQDHPDILHQADEAPSISEALETVTNWLERVAERDPMLFRELMGRMNFKKVDIVKTGDPTDD